MNDKVRDIYVVITADENKSIYTMDGYRDLKKARVRGKQIAEDIKSKGYKLNVYLSSLQYYLYKNTYVDNDFITDDSELIYRAPI